MAVIFGENALTEKTIEDLFAYVKNFEQKFVWSSNLLGWPKGLTVTNGVVLTHKLPPDWETRIMNELFSRGKLPYNPKSRSVMFYAWHGGSNITWHSDYNAKNSMTIYLSKNWNPDHGGYFCWKDWDESLPKNTYGKPPVECKMRLPIYNNYVYMTEAEWHTTTLTVPSAPPRFSLQMFFSKD